MTDTADIPLMSRDGPEATMHEEAQQDFWTKQKSNFKSNARAAWKFTVASGVLAGTVILLINIVTLAVVYSQHHSSNSSIPFFTGSCETASRVVTGAHFVINVLSTILLAYSNFSMQCLASPTRKEVDLAHKKQHWLSIGTPSIRNLFFVSKTKAALWLVLAVSSFPLHLIWNSTVFQTKASYDYLAISVTEEFLHGATWTLPPPSMRYQSTLHEVPLLENWTNEDVSDVLRALQRDALESNLEKLDLKECIETYHTNLLSDRQHVLLVSDNFTAVSTSLYDLDDSTLDSLGLNEAPANSSVATIYYAANPPSGDAFIPLYYWLCNSRPSITPYSPQPCPLDTFNYTEWLPGDDFEWLDRNGGGMFGWNMLAPVRSCYSQKVPERCKASIIPAFMVVVIICNVIKIVSFASALYISRKHKDQPLCTTGDAIQSFLQHPDPCTKGRCLAAKEDYDKWLPRSKEWIPRLITVGDVWTGGRYRWRKAIKKWQWIVFLPTTGGLMALLIAMSVLDSKVSSTKITDISEMYRSNRLNEEPINVLRGFLIGNTPQLVISYLYLALNNIMSTMLAMAEWCNYAVGSPQKGLRVSSRERNTAQRSSYFLSVPYKWAIPSAVALTILHWLVSQTVFFANLEIYRLQPRGVMEPLPSGYLYQSPLAGAIAGSLGSALVVALILAAFIQKYPANIPLSGCCSASIAAACHPSRDLPDDRAPPREFDPDLAYLKLKWGVVEEPDEDADGIGHATFAADDISPLVEEKVYA